MRTPNVECIVCGKPLYRRRFEIQKARYFACYLHREIAKKMVEPTEKQLKALELGREKGTNHLEGIAKSESSKQKRSVTMKKWVEQNSEKSKKRGECNRGENHYKWKGGISNLNQSIRTMDENRKWMNETKKRDGKCVICGSHHNLESHHIKPLSKIIEDNNVSNREEARGCKELWDLENGITLCRKCHYELEGRNYDCN